MATDAAAAAAAAAAHVHEGGNDEIRRVWALANALNDGVTQPGPDSREHPWLAFAWPRLTLAGGASEPHPDQALILAAGKSRVALNSAWTQLVHARTGGTLRPELAWAATPLRELELARAAGGRGDRDDGDGKGERDEVAAGGAGAPALTPAEAYRASVAASALAVIAAQGVAVNRDTAAMLRCIPADAGGCNVGGDLDPAAPPSGVAAAAGVGEPTYSSLRPHFVAAVTPAGSIVGVVCLA
jgi:hypothetical protein